MKIQTDKVQCHPPHNLLARDVRFILAAVPKNWHVDVKEVRIANSLEHHFPYAYFHPYDGSLVIYSRRGTKEQCIRAVLSALAVEPLGMNRGFGRERAESEKQQLAKIVDALADAILAAMSRNI